MKQVKEGEEISKKFTLLRREIIWMSQAYILRMKILIKGLSNLTLPKILRTEINNRKNQKIPIQAFLNLTMNWLRVSNPIQEYEVKITENNKPTSNQWMKVLHNLNIQIPKNKISKVYLLPTKAVSRSKKLNALKIRFYKK